MLIVRHYIDNQELSPAVVAQFDVTREASFINDEIQANEDSNEFEFILDAYDILKGKIDNGGIMSKIPYRIDAVDNGVSTMFSGLVAFREGVSEKPFSLDLVNSPSISTTVRTEGLNNLFFDLEGIDFGFLEDRGVLTQRDYFDTEYVVEANYSPLEILLVATQIVAFTIALIDNTYKLIAAVNTFLGILAAGITGSVGAAIFSGLQVIAILAYQAGLAIALANLLADFRDTFFIPKRNTKSVTLKTLFSKMLNHFGYSLETNITELEEFAITPSNKFSDILSIRGFIETPQGSLFGRPSAQDAGYNCLDFLQIMKDLFNAKVAISNKVLSFYRTLDPIWQRTSAYKLPSLQPQASSLNISELISNYVINFTYDTQDIYTTITSPI